MQARHTYRTVPTGFPSSYSSTKAGGVGTTGGSGTVVGSSTPSQAQNLDEAVLFKHANVKTLDAAFRTTTAQLVMWVLIVLSNLSAVAIGLSMPYFAFVPGGAFDADGRLNFISVGFKKHSALASLIYGLGTTYISIVRTFAIIIYVPRPINALFYMGMLLVGIGAGIGTTRYDELESTHMVMAVLWIVSSLVYHGGVMAWNKTFSEVNNGFFAKGIWLVNVVTAVLLVTYLAQSTSNVERTDFYLIAGIFEYVTVGIILLLDIVLIYSIQTRYVEYPDTLLNRVLNAPEVEKHPSQNPNYADI